MIGSTQAADAGQRHSRRRNVANDMFSTHFDIFKPATPTVRPSSAASAFLSVNNNNNAATVNTKPAVQATPTTKQPAVESSSSSFTSTSAFANNNHASWRGMYKEQEIARQRNEKLEAKERLKSDIRHQLQHDSMQHLKQGTRYIEAAVKISPHMREPALNLAATNIVQPTSMNSIYSTHTRKNSANVLEKSKNKETLLYKIP